MYLDCAGPVVEKKAYLSHQLNVRLVARRWDALCISAGTRTNGVDRAWRSTPTKVRRRYVLLVGLRDLELLPQSLQANRHPPNHALLRCSPRRPRSRRRRIVGIIFLLFVVGVCRTTGTTPVAVPRRLFCWRWPLLASPLSPPLGRSTPSSGRRRTNRCPLRRSTVMRGGGRGGVFSRAHVTVKFPEVVTPAFSRSSSERADREVADRRDAEVS